MNLANNASCTGCAACYSACPKSAIKMVSDRDGFLHPQIDETICVKCGLCEASCPVISKHAQSEDISCYGLWAKSSQLQGESSSGGVFTLMAESVISDGGVVYGASMDDHWVVSHQRVDNLPMIPTLRKSKYVQSEVRDSYTKVSHDLRQGRKVLYVGTPCQIAGLTTYLNATHAKVDLLTTIDLICYGCPSSELFDQYRKEITKEHGRITEVNFRSKAISWKEYAMEVSFANGDRIVEEMHQNPFGSAFLGAIALRESCYSCNFRAHNRHSDITIGDFWGVEKIIPEPTAQLGCNIAIAHTEKGEVLLSKISNSVIVSKVNADEALAGNFAYFRSPNITPARDKFLRLYKKTGIVQAAKRAHAPSYARRLIAKCRSILSRVMSFGRKGFV